MRARFFILAGIGVLLALPAAGQDRPTLARLEEYACISADARNDDYRPIFCESRCDCLSGVSLLAAVNSCEQQPSGKVLALWTDLPATAECFGVCVSGDVCLEDSDCNSGTCDFDFLGLALGSCMLNGPTCVVDGNCDEAKGFGCENVTFGGSSSTAGVCTRGSGSCSAAGACEANVQHNPLWIELDFAPASDPTPQACTWASAFGGAVSGSSSVNSRDLGACIDEIEVALGPGACVICGDGNLDPGEQCDDGNLAPGDGCAADCTNEP